MGGGRGLVKSPFCLLMPTPAGGCALPVGRCGSTPVGWGEVAPFRPGQALVFRAQVEGEGLYKDLKATGRRSRPGPLSQHLPPLSPARSAARA